MQGWRAARKLGNPELAGIAEVLVTLSSQLRASCRHPEGMRCYCRDRASAGEQLAARLSRMIARA
jgi:hypothetical protein